MSLHHKAILVDLTLTGISTSRIDQSVTADVLRNAGAKNDAGRWVSRLWPKEAIDPITRHDSKTGSLHREMTLPWLDNSKRILPTSRFEEYMATMRERKPERADLVKEFIGNFDYWMSKAKEMRKDLFRQSEYPDRASAAARFSFRVEAEPVPHKGDFRVSLAQDDMAEMQSVLDERIANAEKIARNELIARICEPLQRIVERFADPDAKFKDSIIENVRTLATAIPAMNVTDDQTIEDARQRILSSIAQLEPERLRESKSDRRRAAAAANDILAAIAPWAQPIDAAA